MLIPRVTVVLVLFKYFNCVLIIIKLFFKPGLFYRQIFGIYAFRSYCCLRVLVHCWRFLGFVGISVIFCYFTAGVLVTHHPIKPESPGLSSFVYLQDLISTSLSVQQPLSYLPFGRQTLLRRSNVLQYQEGTSEPSASDEVECPEMFGRVILF